jgi:hypothetical protein
MTAALNGTTVMLFMAAIFPGLISTTVYRLLMPARAVDWGSALLQGLFYSAINLVLGLPILFLLVIGRDPLVYPVHYCVAAFTVLLLFPVVWPVLLVRLFKSKFVARAVSDRMGLLLRPEGAGIRARSPDRRHAFGRVLGSRIVGGNASRRWRHISRSSVHGE